ncbi:hypothetical protein L484_009353 [Morus notabilis]|uniref:Uncharacterized protein n=1 Tax=Morus notabilis TaxID=981085 RepID=W9R5P4_9ROSA|nr:hypothetical protein L484_009353 [Morus notabilis]
MPPGAVTLDDVDLDQVSVDFVLNCAKKGGMLELAEAIRDYHDSIGLPQMNNTGSVGEFFLVTDPKVSGSPPKRAPPPLPDFTPPPVYTPPPILSPTSDLTPIADVASLPAVSNVSKSESFNPPLPDFTPPPVYTPPPILSPTSDLTPIADVASLPAVSNVSKSESFNSTQVQELTVDDIEDFDDDDNIEEVINIRMSRRNRNDATDIAVKLPSFVTGITDDDLRETAYEILLACAGASGGLIVPAKEKKKDKRYKLMRTLGRSRTESIVSQSQRAPGLVGLLETMRVQMEISEAMDIRTRQGLLNALSGKVGKRMDALLVPLELLCCISRSEFSDKKAYIRWQKRQFLPSSTGELQRTECLRALRESAIPLAERPSRGDLTGEVCHWADGYHLNVRLYEKLLLSVFDVLDEGKLTEEVEEMLELFKSTWRVLGITETIHCTCYAWVLFRQYVITSDQGILQHAIEQLKRIPLKEQRGPQERLHLKSLRTKIEGEMGSQDVTFLNSFLAPIQKWADKHLGDYHLHFAEVITASIRI